MKIKEIQDIINFIKKTDLDDVSIETENYKIRVKKNNTSITKIKDKKEKAIKLESPIKETKHIEDDGKKNIESGNIIIKSPMIGTFYRSPNPESDSFVNEGDTIKPGSTTVSYTHLTLPKILLV